MGSVTMVDETTAGERAAALVLDFVEDHINVRELIRRRVYEEVSEFNARQLEHFRGLVQPTDAERTLNGYKMAAASRIDFEAQFNLAVRAFLSNGFIVLVGDRQIEDIDEEFDLPDDTTVTFLRLIPLVGG